MLSFSVVRYEDFSVKASEHAKKVLEFFDLAMNPKTKKFLKSHTNASRGGVSSTFRDSKTTPFKWRSKLTWDEIKNIQSECKEALELWGYRIYGSQEEVMKHLPTDDVLKPKFTLI